MLKSKYITSEDFKEYFGIDLNARLKDDDNSSNKVNAFLYRIETQVATACDSRFARKIEWEYPQFSDYQKEHYKLALLHQAYYVLINGEINNDSGYDLESGVVANRKVLENIAIGSEAIDHLRLCGLWCTHLNCNKGGGVNGWWR